MKPNCSVDVREALYKVLWEKVNLFRSLPSPLVFKGPIKPSGNRIKQTKIVLTEIPYITCIFLNSVKELRLPSVRINISMLSNLQEFT